MIYARYSTDHQSEASIEDQLRICRRLAEARGWTVTGTYTDAAISGTVLQRPEFQRLIADAGKRRFDALISEGLDRISRDQEHVAGFYKQMVFLGIPLATVAESEINELHIGLRVRCRRSASKTSPSKPIAALKAVCAMANPLAA